MLLGETHDSVHHVVVSVNGERSDDDADHTQGLESLNVHVALHQELVQILREQSLTTPTTVFNS